jgi:hypothetical protein
MKICHFLTLIFLNLDENTHILSLKNKLIESHIFKKWIPRNVKNNAFSTYVTHLWFVTTNIQFIFNPYATTSYCTSYMTKIDKSITPKLHFIIQNVLQII